MKNHAHERDNKPEPIRQRHILNLLKRRIEQGTYLDGLPAERELSDEIGVARMTARKALQTLVNEGIATRLNTGRLVLSDATPRRKTITMLIPALASHGINAWVNEARQAASTVKAQLCVVYYESFYDVTLMEAFRNADGLFFIARAEEIPRWVMRALQSHPKVVVLETDMSDFGLPSINFFTPTQIHKLLNHLLDQGHSSVDCINDQPSNAVIDLRIATWREWCSTFGVKGELIDLTEVPHSRRKQKVLDFLANRSAHQSAAVCTSLDPAQLAMRAAFDLGIAIGKEFSVSLMDGERQSDKLVPSITSLERPSAERYLRVCMEWMSSPDARWQGSLSMNGLEATLVVGESTGPRA